jgi:hypothetical protein
MLGNVRRLEAFGVGDERNFNGVHVVGTLRNLATEVCERARLLDNDSGRMRERIGAVATRLALPQST